MNQYLRGSLIGMLNQPLAMRDDYTLALRSALLGELSVSARVRNIEQVPEVDARQALAAMTGLTTDGAGRARRPYQLSGTGIACIEILGPLVRSADIWDRIFGGVYSYDDLSEQIMFASEDSECRGIFIHFNSPGGRVDGMVDCADLIAKCSARNGGKPIFGYAGDFACSAAYLLLSACDKTFMSETGQVGSIGVLMLYADLTGMYEQSGIEIQIFRSRPGKALTTAGLNLPAEEADRIQRQSEFLGGIMEKRIASFMPPLTQSAVAETNGLDYTSDLAKAIGLINDVVSMPEAWAKLERRIAR